MHDGAQMLGRRMAKGAAWTVLARLAVRCIGLVSMVILARLLVPEDFGLVALATLVLGLLEVTAEFGFGLALIQNQTAGRGHYDTAWTLSVLRGVVVALVMLAVAQPAAAFFDEPRLAAVLAVLALAPLIEGVANIGVINFQKDLEFGKDFVLMTAAKLGSFAVTVTLAVLWRDYWALVVGAITAKGSHVVLSYLMQPYRPRLSLAEWRSIFHFSKWIQLNSVFSFVATRFDTFIVGKLLGAQTLGLYSVAYEISTLVTSELIMPIRRVLFPGFAKIADDRDRLRQTFVDSLALMMLAGVPLSLGIALVAEPAVRVFLGPKWMEAAPLVSVLAIYGLVHVVNGNFGTVFLAIGRPHLLTALTAVGLCFALPLVGFGAMHFGALGAAVGIAAAGFLSLVVEFAMMRRVLDVSLRRLLAATWRTGLAAAAMTVAVSAVPGQWSVGDSLMEQALWLAAMVGTGALTYVGVHLGLWRLSGLPNGAESFVFTALKLGVARVNRG